MSDLAHTNPVGYTNDWFSPHEACVNLQRFLCVFVEDRMMPAGHTPRQCRLRVSSDSDEEPLSQLTETTPSKAGSVSDDMAAGSYSDFKPRVTSTPKVFDNLKVSI